MRVASTFEFSEIIKPGDHVAWPQGSGEPITLTRSLIRALPALPKLTVVVGMGTSPTLSSVPDSFSNFLCLNGAGGARHAVASSMGRVIPAHLSEIPRLIESRRIPVDIVLIRVRPTDDPETYSLGVMVDFVHEMISAARVVVAEVDLRMPRTFGDVLVPRKAISHFVECDGPEVLVPDPEPSSAELLVARRVSELIPDRATIQLGVGSLPSAVAKALGSHTDLGIHSGVISDAVVPLIENGVVTNQFKGLDCGLTVTGGLFGSDVLNRFADGNSQIAMRRATYTHSARTLAQLERLFSINSAIAVDLSGQVNSEIAKRRYIGAVGGQVDFVRGARLSSEGRSIIALTSTTPDEKHSKIVADLAGAPVTTARSDTDLVVTEYGVADIWGLDLRARAKALVAIAHPKFQEQLERQLA